MTEDEETWLAQLKKDDEVALFYRYTGYQIVKVGKRTPGGQIILENGTRFDKRGREIGGGKWDSQSLSPVTQHIRDTIKHKNLVQRVNSILCTYGINTLDKMQDDHLEQIITCFNSIQKEQ